MKPAVRVILALALVAGLAVGGWFLYQRFLASPTAAAATTGDTLTQTVAVKRGSLAATLSVVGELEAAQYEDLSFSRLNGNATLQSLEAAAGNQVVAGQVLATIDPSSYQQALDQARSDLADAEEKLADLQEPATALEIAQADVAVAQADLALRQAEEELASLADPDIADLEAEVASARLALAESQAALTALQVERETTVEDRLYKLRETESDKGETYQRLAGENYSDVFYQDRLLLARNAYLDAQEARRREEIQAGLDLLRAQAAIRKNETSLAEAESALAEAQAGGDALALARAEHAVAQAEVDLLAAQEARADLETGATAVELAVAQADVDKKRLAVREAELDLNGTKLTAPFAGTILETHAVAGAKINGMNAIVTLADMTQLQVVASVDETTIRQISSGQTATVSFDAFPNRTFDGQVREVPMVGALQGGVMVYDVTVALSGIEGLALRVGMTANLTVHVGSVENALLIPTLALQNVGGAYQVMVAGSTADGAPETVPVEIGLSDGVYTQIVRGLNDGDQIVMEFTSSSDQDMESFRMMMGGGGPGGGPGGAMPPAGAGGAPVGGFGGRSR